MGSSATSSQANWLAAVLPFNSLLALIGLWLGYQVLRALYNISPFHPLSRFPGPKRACCSYAYEAYHDWWLEGRYGRKIAEMHAKYGPVVRINPDELHCNDPLFTDEIYASGGRIRDKWQHQLNTGGAGPVAVTGFSTVAHELHRSRRAALNRFFSRAQVMRLEGEVNDFAQRCVAKMLTFAGRESFDVKEAFNCFTADIISQYAFGEPMGFIDQEGWEPNFATWVKSFFKSAYMMRHNTPARKLAAFAPMLADYMGDDVKAVMRQMTHVIPKYVQAAIDNPDNGRVFADLMETKTLPPEEKTIYRLSGEGFNFLLAGTETTAASLTVITFHLLDKPQIYAKLMSTLEGMNPDNLKWSELEQIPYIWAIIHESLRMMPGVSHRSARIAREEDLVYRSEDGSVEWVIPRGTPIGMTSMINHWNEALFPNPDEFNPDRWLLDNGQPNHALEKRLIAFSRGTRDCIGRQLAYCEIYIMVALMAMKVLHRARLDGTTIKDISYDHDLIVVQTPEGSISTRIAIK
ncbi:benzoate 4-monooxygenase cytochrome P450 [Xylariomycetidae sp. FL0641]|nr:benzoate 4-monooxygenase cytochrome P450 [Xylariomycetidae sp. FL0641]